MIIIYTICYFPFSFVMAALHMLREQMISNIRILQWLQGRSLAPCDCWQSLSHLTITDFIH